MERSTRESSKGGPEVTDPREKPDAAARPRFEIRVEGLLDPEWSVWLGGMTVSHQPDGTTQLLGALEDQAALHGLLTRLHSLRLSLVSVRRVTQSTPSGE